MTNLKWYDFVTLAAVGILLVPWAICLLVQVWQFTTNWDF